MTWKKGQSGNPSGNKTGERKSTQEKRQLIARIVEGVLNDETALEELFAMEDKAKKWDIVAKLLPYYIPKLDTETVLTNENGDFYTEVKSRLLAVPMGKTG